MMNATALGYHNYNFAFSLFVYEGKEMLQESQLKNRAQDRCMEQQLE